MPKILSSLTVLFCLSTAFLAEAQEKTVRTTGSRSPASLVSTEGMRSPVARAPSWHRDGLKRSPASQASTLDSGSQIGPIRVVQSSPAKDLGQLNK